MIECNDNVFRLATAHTAYLFRVTGFGHLEHLHYGGPVSVADGAALAAKTATPTAWTIWPSNGAAWARAIFGTRPRS